MAIFDSNVSINSDTNIHTALNLIASGCKYELDQEAPPHNIVFWSGENEIKQPTDQEINAAWIKSQE